MTNERAFPRVEFSILTVLLDFGSMYETEIARFLVGFPASTTAVALANLKRKRLVTSKKSTVLYRSVDGYDHHGQQLYSLTKIGRTVIQFANNTDASFRPSLQSPYSPIRDPLLDNAADWLAEGRRRLKEHTAVCNSVHKLRYSRMRLLPCSYIAKSLEEYITLDNPHSTSADQVNLLKNRVDMGLLCLSKVNAMLREGDPFINQLVPIFNFDGACPIFLSKITSHDDLPARYPKDTVARRLIATEGSGTHAPVAVQSARDLNEGQYDRDFESITVNPPMDTLCEMDLGSRIVSTQSSFGSFLLVAHVNALGSMPLRELVSKSGELADKVASRTWKYKFMEKYILGDMMEDFGYLKTKSKTLRLLSKAVTAS